MAEETQEEVGEVGDFDEEIEENELVGALEIGDETVTDECSGGEVKELFGTEVIAKTSLVQDPRQRRLQNRGGEERAGLRTSPVKCYLPAPFTQAPREEFLE